MIDKLDKLKCEVKKLSKLRLRDEYIHLYLSHDMLKYTQKELYKNFHQKEEKNKQLKQQLAEKNIRIEELEGQFAYECECNKQLVELQKQLEKKQNEIDEINKEFVQAVHDWKALCAEKDKEIEKLKSEIVKECKEHQDFIKEAKQITNQLKSNYQTQLAIQELEKAKDLIKHFCEIHSDEFYGVKSQVKGIEQDVCESIDYQIKILKGE